MAARISLSESVGGSLVGARFELGGEDMQPVRQINTGSAIAAELHTAGSLQRPQKRGTVEFVIRRQTSERSR